MDQVFLTGIDHTSRWLLTGLGVLSGLVVGLLLDRLPVPWFLGVLLRAYADTRRIVTDSLRGPVLLWMRLLTLGPVLALMEVPPWPASLVNIARQLIAIVSLCWVLLHIATDLAKGRFA